MGLLRGSSLGVISLVLSLLIAGLFIPIKGEANGLKIDYKVENIDKQIQSIEDNAKRSKKEAIIISAKEAKMIHDLQTMKLFKKDGLEDLELPINQGNFMILTGDSTMKIKRELKDIEKQVIHEEIENVLDNIELDGKYIKDLTFIVSPYELQGINGFTLSKTKNGELSQYVVISYSPGLLELGGKIHRELVRSTILHELGHTYKNRLEKEDGKNFEKNYRKYYAEISIDDGVENTLVQQWQMSENENFAEDFRVYYSDKLDGFSFKSRSKKTIMPYNHKVHCLFKTYSKS